MLFRRNRPSPPAPETQAGTALSRGTDVLWDGLLHAADSLVVSGDCGFSLHPLRPGVSVHRATDPAQFLGLLCGHALTGLRAIGLSAEGSLPAADLVHPSRNLPLTLHLLGCGSSPLSTSGSPDGFGMQLAAVPGTLQESVDFALIAQRVAELALAPAVVVHDTDRLLRVLQRVERPSAESIRRFLGSPGDEIGAPTPAQELLFGDTRRRIPRLLGPSLPAGIGSRPAGAAESLVESSYRRFVLDHIPALLGQTLAEFQRVFGRTYRTVDVWGRKEAPFALIVTGPDAYAARAVISARMASGEPPVCILRLPFVSPFPGDLLSGLLQGKRAVAVLEPGAETAGMVAQEVERAIMRSLENGRSDQKELPHPDHAVYLTAESVPRIQVASLPNAEPAARRDTLESVVTHLTGSPQSRLTVPGAAIRPTSPHVERHRQVLARAYPSPAFAAAPPVTSLKSAGWVVCGSAEAEEEELFEAVVRALQAGIERPVRTERFPLGESALLSAFVGPAKTDEAPGGRVPIGLAVTPRALHRPELWNSVEDGGLVVTLLQSPVGDFWAGISPELRRTVEERKLRLLVLDEIPAGAAASGALDGLVVLTGALVAVLPGLEDLDRAAWRDRTIGELGRDASVRAFRSELFARGFDQASSTEALLPPVDVPASAGPGSPRALRHRQPAQPPLLDPVQHWNLFLSRAREGLPLSPAPDPTLAISAVPAAGVPGAFPPAASRNMPRWIPESCSACGKCWTFCPESAIGVFAVSFGEALAQALTWAEADGKDVFPIRRLEKALTAQAQRLIKADDLGQHRTLGSVLDEAYRILAERLESSAEERARIEGGIETVRSRLGDVKVRRVDGLFIEAEKREKGSGRVLSIGVDPDYCTSCGLCVAVCPDAALESRPLEPGHLAALGPVLDLLEELRRAFVLPDDLALPTPELASFLSDSVAQSFRAGDLGFPGSGSRIGLRAALAGALRGHSGHMHDAKIELKQVIGRVESRIRARLAEPFQVNDLEAFAARLDVAGPAQLDAATLAALVAGEGGPRPDTAHVRMLIDTLQALRVALESEERLQTEFGAGGLLLGIAVDGPLERLYRFPSNPHPFPWLFLEHGKALGPALSGVLEGWMRDAVERARLVRRARLLADGAFDAGRHESDLAALSWMSLSESERSMVPAAVLVTDQEEAWDSVARDRLPVTVLLLTSRPLHLLGTAAAGDPTRGALALRQPAIAALLEPGLFVAQSSISRPEHLIRCIGEAVAADGPALVHVLAPEPSVSGLAPDETVAHAEAAVACRVFPVFVRRSGAIDRSALLIDLSGNPDPDRPWVSRSSVDLAPVSFRGTDVPLTPADWAVDEGSLAALFRRLPRSEADALLPVAHGPQQAGGPEGDVKRFAVSTRPGRSEVRFEVAPEMLDTVRQIGETWRLLLELSGAAENPAVLRFEEFTSRLERERAESESAIRSDYEARLAALEADQGARLRSRLIERLRTLTGLSGGANGSRTTGLSGTVPAAGEEAPSQGDGAI